MLAYSTMVQLAPPEPKGVPEIFHAWSEDHRLQVMAYRVIGSDPERYSFRTFDREMDEAWSTIVHMSFGDVILSTAEFMGAGGDWTVGDMME